MLERNSPKHSYNGGENTDRLLLKAWGAIPVEAHPGSLQPHLDGAPRRV